MVRRAMIFLSLTACNAVFGLEEGSLGEGGAGTGAGGVGGASNTTSEMTNTSTGGGPASSTAITSTGVGGGSECVLLAGLTNEDFSEKSGSTLVDWLDYSYASDPMVSSIPGSDSGLVLVVDTTGNLDGYGGVYQQKSIFDLPWDQCVQLRGDAKLAAGRGQFQARAEFGDYELLVTLPDGPDFAPFAAQCRLPIPIMGYNVEIEVNQIPDLASLHMHEIHFDHICCDLDPPLCPLDPTP